MTKEDIEKSTMTKVSNEKTKTPERTKPKVVEVKQWKPLPECQPSISAQLDEVVLEGDAKPANLTSE
jgi:hypothetical protein